MANSNNEIYYSQCWEDPALVIEALAIGPEDVVLSITSGGDNSLAILLQKPKQVISLDLNVTQKYVLELKLAAIQSLNYEEFLEFLGVRKSFNRERLFEKVEKFLSREALSWWKKNGALIRRGIIHCGRFEKFLNSFRRYVLPFIHSEKTTEAFLNNSSLQAQRDFYENIWNSRRWRIFFQLITSRLILRNFARQRGMFNYTKMQDVAKEYLRRLEQNFNMVPIKDNYYMRYCLIGNYNQIMPPYLDAKNFPHLKENLPCLSIVVDNLTTYLKSVPDNFFTKFNLSDIFEALSPEQNDVLWQEIIRTSKNGAKVVYWNNLIPRTFPKQLAINVKDNFQLANKLHSIDRAFFYGSFHVNIISK